MTTPASRNTVLFVSALSTLGGAQVSLASVVSELAPNIRVVVAAPAAGPFVDRLRASGAVTEFVAIPSLERHHGIRARLEAARVLGYWLWRNRRTLLAVHVNGDSELKLLLPVFLLVRRPVVVWHHRAELTSTVTRLRPLWRLLRRTTIWAAVSEARRAELEHHGIATQRNLLVVPNPIDPHEVVPDVRAPHDKFVVGYLGCEYESKGILLLPSIAAGVVDSEIELVVVTKGLPPELNSAEVNCALDRLRSIPSTVTFRRRDFDVRHIYTDLDAVVVPSQHESFCRIAAEAMLNEQPVVATDLPALRELVGDEAGVLFPPGDSVAAAEALRTLADDPALVARLGQEGRRRAEQFAPARVAQRLLALYRSPRPVDVRELDS